MPSRKQKRREAKSKRHEYEFVYLDSEGNELEEPPEELVTPSRAKASSNGSKAAPSKQPAQQTRGRREPQPPSWQRAGKRALILGAVVFALFALTNKKGGYTAALPLALIYTVLFVPFTYGRSLRLPALPGAQGERRFRVAAAGEEALNPH